MKAEKKPKAELVLNDRWKFSKIYKAVWESKVSAKAKLVFAALEWHGERKFPRHRRLADMCSLSVAGVKRAIEELEAAGFLGKTNRLGMTNQYELFPEGNQGVLNLAQCEPGLGDLPVAQPEPGINENLAHPDPLTRLKTNDTPNEIPSGESIPTRPLTDYWTTLMVESTGDKGNFQRRDGLAARNILQRVSLDRAKEVVKWAITKGRFDPYLGAKCQTLWALDQNWNLLIARIAGPVKKTYKKMFDPQYGDRWWVDGKWVSQKPKDCEAEELVKMT